MNAVIVHISIVVHNNDLKLQHFVTKVSLIVN